MPYPAICLNYLPEHLLANAQVQEICFTSGGEMASTGIVGVTAAYRGPTLLAKQVENKIIANDYDLAMAA